MTESNDHVLYVVMNGRVIGDIQRSSQRRMRLRYTDPLPGRFTPLSLQSR
jgi:serine/threonine-protein kinase HipA